MELHAVSPMDSALETIEAYIYTNRIAPNGKLPGERELCEQLGLSRTTVRAAIARLTDVNLLYRVRGSGTFVSPPKLKRNLKDNKSTAESALKIGHVVYNAVLEKRVIRSTAYIAGKLGIEEGTEVFELKRLRYDQNTPFAIELDYCEDRRYPGLEKEDFAFESLFRALRARGADLSRGNEHIGITYATKEEAELLKIEEGSPLFYISGVCLDRQDNPVDFFKSVVRPDIVQFYDKLIRIRHTQEEQK